MERGAWWAVVHSPRGRKESATTERLTHTHTHTHSLSRTNLTVQKQALTYTQTKGNGNGFLVI